VNFFFTKDELKLTYKHLKLQNILLGSLALAMRRGKFRYIREWEREGRGREGGREGRGRQRRGGDGRGEEGRGGEGRV
jgi:hypothetical protein